MDKGTQSASQPRTPPGGPRQDAELNHAELTTERARSDWTTRRPAWPASHELIADTIQELFPALSETAITHRWGGVLGIPRDWRPSVGLDRATGMAWAGGYVGEGVAAANLAGRTLADLILERDSDLVSLPWVDHRSRRWEPEPLRWIGISSMLRLTALADRAEERNGRPSRLGAIADRLR